MYKLINNLEGVPSVVQRMSDFAQIPFDLDNTDYQAYLAWVSEGNEPLPAEEVL